MGHVLHRDVRAAVDLCHRDGSLKQAVAQDPAKYIHEDKRLAGIIDMYRAAGKKLFVATNSLWDYTHVVMNFLLSGRVGSDRNEDWLEYFDVVITGQPVHDLLHFLASLCKPAMPGMHVITIISISISIPMSSSVVVWVTRGLHQYHHVIVKAWTCKLPISQACALWPQHTLSSRGQRRNFAASAGLTACRLWQASLLQQPQAHVRGAHQLRHAAQH